jgi:hypothetical protein
LLPCEQSGCVIFRVENLVNSSVEVSTEVLREHTRRATSRRCKLNETDGTAHASQCIKLETQSGLAHISLACKAAKGAFDVSVSRKGSETSVVATMSFPAVVVDKELSVTEIPSTSTAMETPVEDLYELPQRLKVCAIDDSMMICKGYERILLKRMNADVVKSQIVCCESRAQAASFLNSVLGEEADNDVPADVAILDQNIDISGVS